MSILRYRFVGLRTLPKLSEEDAELHCSLSPQQLEAIAKLTPLSSNETETPAKKSAQLRGQRLALAVHVVFLNLTGTHAGSKKIMPVAMLRLLCRQLAVPETHIASLQSLFDRPATLTEQRQLARAILGFSSLDDATERRLADVLALRAAEAISTTELETIARQWLFDQRIVVTSERAIQDMARKAFAAIELLALNTVKAAMPAAWLRNIVKFAFSASPRDGMTVLEWLKTYEGKHGLKNLGETVKKLTFLRELKVDEWDFSALSSGRIREFSLRVQHRPPSDTKKLPFDTQAVEVACFYVYTLGELSDEVIYRNGRHTADLERMGQGKVTGRRASVADALFEGVTSMRRVLHDASKTYKQRCDALAPMMDDLLLLGGETAASIVRQTLVQEQVRVNTILGTYESLNIVGDDPKSKDSRLWERVKELRAEGIKELPDNFDASCVDSAWKELVADEDRKRGWAALQACAAVRVREGLRGGRLHVGHSATYRSKDECLYSPEVWDARKEEFCAAFGLSLDPTKFLDKLKDTVETRLQDVAGALAANQLEIKDDRVHVPKITEETEKELFKELGKVQSAIFGQIGQVQLPDVMLDVDYGVQFSKILLGRSARSTEELLAVYGALLAHGTEASAKGVAAMIPGLEVSDIVAAMKTLELGTRLRSANAAVVAFQRSFPVAKAWGDGSRGSADMMALDATRHLAYARQNPRRKTMSTGMYTHKLGSYGIFYDQQLVQNTWQDGPAVHGVHEYNAQSSQDRIKIQVLAVDTHGVSYPAMSIAKFLGFDLCPQLAHLPDKKLFIARGWAIPEELEGIAKPAVSLKAITEAWPEMMRVISSILSGKTTVAWVMSRMGSAAKGDPVHRGFEELGKLLRTLFLCDYFSNEDFRRELHTLLNRGENVHSMQRAIYYGRLTAERGRRRDELAAITSAHTLLSNIVIAWNTMQLDKAWAARAAAGDRADLEMMRRTAPTHYENINMRGQFSFGGLDRFRERLIEEARWDRSKSQHLA